MIKFFRKIRQKLLTENKFSKYLLYAIGEIILVVIGILIALQVNNWNNENAERDREINILTEMIRNLNMNVNQFSVEIVRQDSIIRNIDVIMNQIKNNIPYHDSLGYKYASVAWTEEFNYANSAFETLKSTGLDLVSSDSLRENIVNTFNVRYLRLDDLVDKVGRAEYAELSTLYIRHIEFDKKGKATINDFDILKKDKEFTNMLSGRRVWKLDLIYIFKELIEESRQLSGMIDLELNDLKK
jgi:hypothetical protein